MSEREKRLAEMRERLANPHSGPFPKVDAAWLLSEVERLEADAGRMDRLEEIVAALPHGGSLPYWKVNRRVGHWLLSDSHATLREAIDATPAEATRQTDHVPDDNGTSAGGGNVSETVKVTLVLPERSEDALSEGLRWLTASLVGSGVGESSFGLGGPDGYGCDFESDLFAMKRYCWCDADDCPWCGGCGCREGRFTHRVEGEPVSYPEWVAAYDEGRERDVVDHGADCDYCLGRGPFSTHGAEPGMGAPNFWHKPSGLKVWWYKYIGRGMEVRNPSNANITHAINECIARVHSADAR